MKNISFLPRIFNSIGIILILVSVILIVIELITTGIELYSEYVAIFCFAGMLLSLVSKGDEEIKYKAVFSSTLVYVIVKIFTVSVLDNFAFYILFACVEYMLLPTLYAINYLRRKYSKN